MNAALYEGGVGFTAILAIDILVYAAFFAGLAMLKRAEAQKQGR